ncbi:ribonuclease HI family protein [bacterium]|nr:ribonuclease HI family protein [bacterium]
MKLTAHTDGASRGNPGHAAIGYTIEKDGIVVEKFCEYIGETTNNIAEYKALIAVLKRLKSLGASEVTIYSDSELMVRQISGAYKVKNEGLRPLHTEVMSLSQTFTACKITHVPRGRNPVADGLANKALDERANS